MWILIWGGMSCADPVPFPPVSQELPQILRQALAQAGVPASEVSVVVWGVNEPRPRLAWEAQTPRNPASVMKLVTTLAALENWGPAKTWRTEVRVPRLDTQRGQGPFGVIGVGDPGLTLERWQELWRQVYQQGIHQLSGPIRFDQSGFSPTELSPEIFDQEGFRAYNVIPHALQVGQQTQWWFIRPGARVGEPLQIWSEFPFSQIVLSNRTRTVSGPCPALWRSGLHYAIRAKFPAQAMRSHPDNYLDTGVILELTGTVPQDCGVQVMGFSLLTNFAYLDSSLRTLWHELGGTFAGTLEQGTVPGDWPVLASSESPALIELLLQMNKNSNNVLARTLLLDLAMNDSEVVKAATESGGRAKVLRILAERGLDFPEMVLENGSGLSRKARISAEHLARLLLWMQEKSLYGNEFMTTLPLVNVDGTLRHSFEDPQLRGRFHLKSGTLDGVKALAGYGLDAQNHWVVVVFLANGPGAESTAAAQEALLRWVRHESKIPQFNTTSNAMVLPAPNPLR
ncbi:D-alanyl-D-alanine carboxypeptidase/D-alanyl-D-alanine-endopeptidase [Ferrovum myxofaciens]|uniref:D-alanyl-D-alanine carboxypeptidase/D-alanyl-D-alanine-endopeptidase n=2 Tax=root TaxID=1 RepID=A0A9E6MUQ3_9PROT|nr:D-alanyl-D-alanine carboxypeptidase/D-alanyl-D-alanine-endopeptidase [Ferrovum myxofaciens]QKE38673.1 MAG: D-alanyl-D-alanine carboxypeptidase/D-alanyl-D-alanine-endopeptidase [Ferrovum myxofaciens]QWY73876.1 MAG: D-alanyl-D-alanine carboxypeptidase/D-alanyl-D-alanine-endopeptidase [Ferrovum myxofaciens]QWY76630.1 MAG: D-alanyl-D-alanine carboxypeptidase/D-alanyl-D-alanine-endopeptidase [Ferrovum myxofaciens]